MNPDADHHGMKAGFAKELKDALRKHERIGGPRLKGGYGAAEQRRYREHSAPKTRGVK